MQNNNNEKKKNELIKMLSSYVFFGENINKNIGIQCLRSFSKSSVYRRSRLN